MKILKTLFLLLAVMFFSSLSARHITGGVITYEYLGNKKYKIVFTIYKICTSSTDFDGDPNNPNGSQFYFGIFQEGSSINLAQDVTLTYKKRENIDPPAQGCVDDNVKECVEQATYEYEFTVPDTTKRYTVVHQRCCRNNEIDNLVSTVDNQGNPTMPGITLRTYIPPTATYKNNAAEFKSFPPLYLCKDKMLYFDHSAIDTDGDSLSYHIVTPLKGLGINAPVSDNQSLSTVGLVTFKTPYNLSNVMGGSPKLTINEESGLLTCRPNVNGWYAVAIMVREYRNGILINSTIRDYQFVVTNLCSTPQSDLPFAPGTFDAKGIADYSPDCNNYTIDFKNLSTGSDSFYWNFGEPSAGINNFSTIKEPSHTYSDTGTFLVTLKAFKIVNGVLCEDSIVRRVKIYPKVSSDFELDANAKPCDDALVKVNDKSTSNYTTIQDYVWTVEGKTFVTKDINYTFTSSGKKMIKLKVIDDKKCEHTIEKEIEIFDKPVFNTINKSLCLGQELEIDCQVTVAPPSTITSYKWDLPDGSSVNSCAFKYTPTSSGNVLAQNTVITDKGCTDSFVYSFPVRNLPNVNCTPDTKICYDKNLQLSVSGASTYKWTPSTYLDNPNIATPTANVPYPNSQKYKVEGTDANGCKNYDSLVVSFHTKPFIDAGVDTSVCLNPSPQKWKNSVTLNGQGNFSNVNWTPTVGLDNPSSRTPVATPLVTTDYIFQGTDANQCIVKDTMKVVVLDPKIDLITETLETVCRNDCITITPFDQGEITTYFWTPGFWVSDRNKRDPEFCPLQSTSYILFVSNYCYDKRDTIQIDVRELPDSKLPDLDSVCYGNVYQFGGNPDPNYTWSWTTQDNTISSRSIHNPTATPPATSKYYVDIVDEIGCQSQDSMTLKVNYPPSITLLGMKPYLCQGDSMKLKVHVSDNVTVRWENKYISDTDTREVYLFPPTSMNYTIRAYTDTTCVNTDTFHINVQEPIVAIGDNNARFCKGRYVELSVGGGLYYRWQPHVFINDTIVPNPQVNPDTDTRYLARIMNDCFEDSIYIDVKVDSLPIVTLPNDTIIEREDAITIVAISDVNNSLEWYPKDDINNPLGNEVSVAPVENSTYYVIATDGLGCQGSDTINVDVIGVNYVLLPSGFSPNGDGINDYFGVLKHKNVKKLDYLDVYNRWGQKVYSAKNIDDKWDGTFGDQPIPTGTYTWMIKIITQDGEIIKKEGNISILR